MPNARPLTMKEVLDLVEEAEQAEMDALMRLEIYYENGRGSPKQRRRAREFLGLEQREGKNGHD